MSRRQQIIDALAARLAVITVANGYTTNAGARVYVWRLVPVVASELPCLLVADNEISRSFDSDVLIGHAVNFLTVDIVAAADGNTTASMARDMEADIVSCLSAWPNAGGLADWLQIDKSQLLLEQHEQVTGAVRVTVVIRYQLPTGQI